MKSLRHLVLLLLAAMPLVGIAGAPPLKVSHSVIVHAAPEVVWATVGHFDGLDHWHPAVAKDEIVAGVANQPGAVRKLTLRDGGTLREKLVGFDAKHHRYRYVFLDGALPVSAYTATISAKAAGPNRTKVTWSGTFKRKDPAANPAANANDATAVKTVSAIYQSGLDNLRKVIPAK